MLLAVRHVTIQVAFFLCIISTSVRHVLIAAHRIVAKVGSALFKVTETRRRAEQPLRRRMVLESDRPQHLLIISQRAHQYARYSH